MAPTSRRAIVLSALLPLVLAALVAVTAPAQAATVTMGVGAGAYVGDGAQSNLSDQAPAGAVTYNRTVNAGPLTAERGTASGTASQTTSIGSSGISATGSGTGSANPSGTALLPRGTATSRYDHKGWAVPASGKWKISLSLRNQGTPAGCSGVSEGFIRVTNGWIMVNTMIGCNDEPLDWSSTVTLNTGQSLDISTSLDIDVNDGNQTASWTVKVEPVSVTPPAVKQAPQSTGAPRITGKPKAGKTLSATEGTWRNDPTTFTFQWLRKGKPIVGAAAPTYKVKKADRGKKISVRVTAGNSAGKATATSKAVKIKKPKKR